MIKYSELKKDYSIDQLDSQKKALVTHFLQNKNTASAKHYQSLEVYEVIKDVKKLINEDIIWDIPFPPNKDFKFTFIDLFAGIGGMRIAFQNLGGKCVFSSEWDKYCQVTYETNFGEFPFGDITKIDEKEIPEHDILLAGIPCQAFSIAGKRYGFKDTRGTLFFHVCRILKEKKPKAFLIENVKGLIHHDKGKTLEVMLDVLRKDLDYYVPEPELVNAKYFGVPQNRERVVIIGFRKDISKGGFYYPKNKKVTKTIKAIKETETVSQKYYLSTRYLETLRDHKKRHRSKGNGFGYEVLNDYEIANAIVVGGMGRERNLVYDNKITDYTPVTNIQGKINREGIRRMTPREWARLQGFPDIFKIPVSDAQAYKQFGNSVAIPAMEATGKKIIKFFLGKQMTKKYNIGEWSEAYVFLKLLGDGKLYPGDMEGNRIPSIFYPIIKIIREETKNKNEYKINGNVVIVNSNGEEITKISVNDFKKMASSILEEMYKYKSTKGNFAVPVTETFFKKIGYTKVKSKSTSKSKSPSKTDIIITIHDIKTNQTPTIGFSIKSQIGQPATLLNSAQSTNLSYKITGIKFDSNKIKTINSIKRFREKIELIKEWGGKIEYCKVDNEIFKNNLIFVETRLPEILGECVLHYYSSKSNRLIDIIKIVKEKDPIQYGLGEAYSIYENRLKKFLKEVALGLVSHRVWNGKYDETEGYLVVKEDGDILCYHLYKSTDFEDYLLYNTKFDTASTTKMKFGDVYKDGTEYYIKLNTQIRFIK